tara:strand:+ start:4612 stop:6447 length:1836 start_codon:yes stop_codon:yes gene_type:complete
MAFFVMDAHAQLGFCQGNSGDPIFMETFGTSSTGSQSLPAGTTTYSYALGTPNDGSYTISNSTPFFDWHNVQDHTQNDTGGLMFVVNASFTAGEFFRRNVDGLCENTSYEFSSWLINLLPSGSSCEGGGLPINVKFQIWDNSDTTLLASGDTGNIFGTATPDWRQYGLTFQTLPGQTSIILKMLNNGDGGCGNDLAIDDIVFSTCGDLVTITDGQDNSGLSVCEIDLPVVTKLTANPDFSIYSTHVYQWQESNDGINWMDIIGATSETYEPPPLTATVFYRVLVAEDAVNLANPLCNSASAVFPVVIVPLPELPVSNGDIEICENESRALVVNVPTQVLVNWYDAMIGGNLVQENSTSFLTDRAGTYYAEAVSSIVACTTGNRTPVTLTIYPLPEVSDEHLMFCPNSNITLSAGIDIEGYQWNTGETTKQITVSSPGEYTVEVMDFNGCSNIKTISLDQIEAPVIKSINSNGYTLGIVLEKEGNYEFSLDGNSYQTSPIFTDLPGGRYTVYVRDFKACSTIIMEVVHFVIPKFFSPNGDGTNDLFRAEGIEFYESSRIAIFDRFGRLLGQAQNEQINWNGTFRGIPLPSSDYWYRIEIDGAVLQGHFALKR